MIPENRTTVPELIRRASVLAAMHRSASAAGSSTATAHRSALIRVLRDALTLLEGTTR